LASLSKNLVANFIGKSWTSALSVLLIPVYIKIMGLESYGLVGFYITLSSVFGILDLGIGSTMNRELARRTVRDELAGSERDLVRTLEIIYWTIAVVIGLIVIFFAPLITQNWLQGQKLPHHIILRTVQLMGGALALQFPMSLYQGGLLGLQKQVAVNAMLVIHGTLRGLGAVLALYMVSPTVEVYFGWQVISSFIGSISFFIIIWMNLPKAPERARFKVGILQEIWKYAAAISANAFIGIILSQLDKVILSKMLNLRMFAYYSIATTASSVIWMIVIPFSTAAFPNLVQMHELGQDLKLRNFFHTSSQTLSLLLLPASAVLIVFSKQILLLWTHNPAIVENSHLLVSCLVFGTMLNGIATFPVDNAMAFGWPQLVTYTNLTQAVAIVPLIIIMVHEFQGLGAAIVWIILNSIYIIFMIPIFFKRYLTEEKTKWYIQDVFFPLAVAFLICLLSQFAMPGIKNTIILAIWVVLTGVVALVATALALPHIRQKAFSIIQRKSDAIHNIN